MTNFGKSARIVAREDSLGKDLISMKKLLALALAFVMVLCFCACGAEKAGGDETTTPTAPEIKVNMELVGSWASADRNHYDKTEENGQVTEENTYADYTLVLNEDSTYTATYRHEKVEIEKSGNTTTKTTTNRIVKISGTWSMVDDEVHFQAEDGSVTIMTYADGILSGSEMIGQINTDFTYQKQ